MIRQRSVIALDEYKTCDMQTEDVVVDDGFGRTIYSYRFISGISDHKTSLHKL